jgi:hypothetical protein
MVYCTQSNIAAKITTTAIQDDTRARVFAGFRSAIGPRRETMLGSPRDTRAPELDRLA